MIEKFGILILIVYKILKQKAKKHLSKNYFYDILKKSTKYGELVEWSNTAVLKTAEVKASWGSNP